MKKLFVLVMFLFLVAGWALAAAALHVVRTEGSIPKVGGVRLVTKDRLTYRETYLDVRGWSDAEVAAHPSLGRKMLRSVPAEEARGVEAGTFSLLVE